MVKNIMTKRTYAIILFLGIVSLMALFPQLTYSEDIFSAASRVSELIPAMSDRELEELILESETTRYYFEDLPPLWLPEGPLKADIKESIATLKTVIGVETVLLLPLEDAGVPDSVDPKSEQFLKQIYNLLRSVSKLKGTEYYSASREKMRTLFARSYAITSPEEEERLEDPLLGPSQGIPRKSTVYAFQEDLTFGENIYSLTYRFSGNTIALTMTNHNELRYGIFKMVDPKNMQTHLLIHPLEDYLLFYGACTVETLRFLGLERSKKESFYNRIQALYGWFFKSLQEHYS
jgi:hypothetical protein